MADLDAIEVRVDRIEETLVVLSERVDGIDGKVDALAAKTQEGFEQVQAAFADHKAYTEFLFDRSTRQIGALDSRFGALETRFGALETRFGALDSRFGALETRFGALETGVRALDRRFDRLEERLFGER